LSVVTAAQAVAKALSAKSLRVQAVYASVGVAEVSKVHSVNVI